MAEEITDQESENNSGENAQDANAPKTFDETYVKKLRDEAASWRTKAQEAANKVKEFETAQMTESDRLKAEAQQAKAEAEAAKAAARQALARAEIAKHAATAGVDVSLAERLVDVEFDDNGKPVKVDEAIKKLIEDHPQLKSGGFGANATNSQRQRGLTIEDIKKMTPEQINARWDEVQKVMAQGQ